MLKPKLYKISELILDQKYYPRIDVNWDTVDIYAEAMRLDAKFPSIKVAVFAGQNLVIDGWHRVHAKIKLQEEYIDGEYEIFTSPKDVFIAAVKYNNTHGVPLTFRDKELIFGTLEKFNVPIKDIQSLINIEIKDIKSVATQSITSSVKMHDHHLTTSEPKNEKEETGTGMLTVPPQKRDDGEIMGIIAFKSEIKRMTFAIKFERYPVKDNPDLQKLLGELDAVIVTALRGNT